jgi:outer membrane protein assembly factor BamB
MRGALSEAFAAMILRFLRGSISVAAVACLIASRISAGADWPQFLGPARNGQVLSTSLDRLPKEGWPLRWKAAVGEGFSGPIVVSNCVYVFHRIGGQEILSAFGITDGSPRWKQALPTGYSAQFGGGDGPSATPAADPERVFALGASGMLRAVSATEGRLLWQVDCAERFGAEPGFFGFGSSPLLLGDRLIVQVGGPEASVVAFSVADGRVLWKAGTDEAGYGSPVVQTRGGRQEVLCFNRAGLLVVDPVNGREQGRFPWRARMHASVNAASPVIVGDGVFITSSYGTGAALLKSDGTTLRPAWSGDEALSAHFATPVLVDGFLYGFHGRQESGPDFRCIDAATGKVRWTLERAGSGSVLAAGRKLLLLMESGEVRCLEANPERPVEMGRFQAGASGARALPAVAQGRFFLRDRSHLLCLELPR